MATVIQLTSLSGSNSSTTYTPTQGNRTSLYDATNPKFPRNITLDNQGLQIFRPGVTPIFYPLTALLALAVTTNGNLTWPPTYNLQPVSTTATFGTATTFPVTVNSELSVTYQWQVSTNAGLSWSNLSNAGVYTGVTTATLAISNVTTVNGFQYRVTATNSQGATTSQAATLTVTDPAITAQPANATVTAPADQNFAVIAVGTSTLEYQWYMSTDAVTFTKIVASGGPSYSNYTTATLTVGVTTGLNNYYFLCMVINNTASGFTAPATVFAGQAATVSGTTWRTSSLAVLTVV